MIDKLNVVMTKFKRLNIQVVNTEQTFMQLTGYPHLENVCSNILEFYMDTTESHNMHNLFIKSLLESVDADTSARSTESVNREVQTDGGNRIDLLIETERYFIAIENKVFSGLDNPLADYEAFVHRWKGEKTPIFILLTLREESAGGSAFVNVTYSQFFRVIRRNMGDYVVTANTKWLVILNDFIRTIESLREGNVMDREFIEFYNQNEADIKKLLDERKKIPKALITKRDAVVSLLNIKSPPYKEDNFVNYGGFNVEHSVSYLGIDGFDVPVVFDISIDTKICEIVIGINGATDEQMKRLEKLLTVNNLNCFIWEGNSDYYLVKVLDVFEPNDTIANEFQVVLDKLVYAERA